VAILDADKEGFLRSETSLIQTIGRTARNVNAQVILYADTVTGSMDRAITETRRRRQVQQAYNREHGITPTTIKKAIRSKLEAEFEARRIAQAALTQNESEYDREELIGILEKEMYTAAESLEFEKAARLRDQIKELKAAPTVAGAKSKKDRA